MEYCIECGSQLEYFESGIYKGVEWITLECHECGHKESNAPDWDHIRDCYNEFR